MFRRDRMTAAECLPWPSGSQALIVRAAVAPDAAVVPAFRAWQAAVDLDGHVDGGTFRLLPLVYDRLRRQGCDDPLMGRLKGIYRKAWSETQTLFHRTAPAIAALEAAGVQTMLLKGAPLALGFYPSVATRPMMDLDILVRPEQAAAALAILGGLGWMPGKDIRPHEMADTHELDLHAGTGQDIDLHWHCLREAPATAADAWFWDGAVPLDFCGVRTLQPAPTGQLLQTVLHGVRSNLEPPTRWIADAMAILQASGDRLDWGAMLAFAQSQKLSYRLQLGLGFLAATYAAPVPSWVLDRLRADGISLIERIENRIYLRGADQAYRPLLAPLVDYWRFGRNMPAWRFLKEYRGYLQRRWRLDHPLQIPAAALTAIGRKLIRRPA
jgi:hypothetical protein